MEAGSEIEEKLKQKYYNKNKYLGIWGLIFTFEICINLKIAVRDKLHC